MSLPGERDYIWFVLLVLLLGLIGGFILGYLMDEGQAHGSATLFSPTPIQGEQMQGRELKFHWLED